MALIGFITYFIIDTIGSRYRLRSLFGISILIAIGFIFSKHPRNVKFQSVFVGFSLQLIFGLISIRWTTGRQIFQCIGDKLANFLSYSKFGAEVVYGNFLVHQDAAFAFAVSYNYADVIKSKIKCPKNSYAKFLIVNDFFSIYMN